MKRTSNWQKAAWDVGTMLSSWSMWFIGIIFLVHLALSFITKRGFDDFLAFSYLSAPLTFFIFGVIGGLSFLPELVKQGVTRKNAYIANVLGVMMAILFVIAVASILTLLERAVLGIVDGNIVWDDTLLDAFLEDSAFANANLANGATPLQWLFALLSYFFNLFFNYLVGWFISTSFYSRGFFAGMAAILLSIGLFIATDISQAMDSVFEIQSETISLSLFGWNASGVASLIGLLLLSLLLLVIIRLLTRRMPVKL